MKRKWAKSDLCDSEFADVGGDILRQCAASSGFQEHALKFTSLKCLLSRAMPNLLNDDSYNVGVLDVTRNAYLIHLVLPTRLAHIIFHILALPHALCFEIINVRWKDRGQSGLHYVCSALRNEAEDESTRPPSLAKIRWQVALTRREPDTSNSTRVTATRLARTTRRSATMAMTQTIATSSPSLAGSVTDTFSGPKLVSMRSRLNSS